MDVTISLSKLRKRRILFSTHEGYFIGTVSNVNKQAAEVTLSKLLWLSNKEMIETRTISIGDILTHESIRMKDIFHTEASLDLLLGAHSVDSCKNVAKKYELILPDHISDRLPTDNTVIDKIDEEFYEAVQHLKRQDVIGLSLEGSEIGRNGILEWLCISTSRCTFLFDIQKLGKDAFSVGLKGVLENHRIGKVLHDCRLASDCLTNQFDTKFGNVYDTQVADFIVNVQTVAKKSISNQVNSLDYCLSKYLQIPTKYLHQDSYTRCCSLRPLNHSLRDLFIKNVVYLRHLKQELDLVIRMPFRRCVDVCLQTIQKRSDQQLKLQPPKLDCIPLDMLIDNIQIFQITEQLAKSSKLTNGKMVDPYHRYEKDCRYYQNGSESDACADSQCHSSFSLRQDNLNTIASYCNRNEITQFLLNKMCLSNEGYNSTHQQTDNLGEFDSYSVSSRDTDIPNLSPSPSPSVAGTSSVIYESRDLKQKMNLLDQSSRSNNYVPSRGDDASSLLSCTLSDKSVKDVDLLNKSSQASALSVKYKEVVEQGIVTERDKKSPFKEDNVSNLSSSSSSSGLSSIYYRLLADKKKLLNKGKSSIEILSDSNNTVSNLSQGSRVIGLSNIANEKLGTEQKTFSHKEKNIEDLSESVNCFSPLKDRVVSNPSSPLKHKILPSNCNVFMSERLNNDLSATDIAVPIQLSEDVSKQNVRSSSRKTAGLSSIYKKLFEQKNLASQEQLSATLKNQNPCSSASSTDELNQSLKAKIEDVPWSKLRSAFSDIGPSNEGQKFVLVPSGMQC